MSLWLFSFVVTFYGCEVKLVVGWVSKTHKQYGLKLQFYSWHNQKCLFKKFIIYKFITIFSTIELLADALSGTTLIAYILPKKMSKQSTNINF